MILIGFLGTDLPANAKDRVLHVRSDKQLFLGPWTPDGRDAHLVASMQRTAWLTGPVRGPSQGSTGLAPLLNGKGKYGFTKLTFAGDRLELNLETGAGGSVRLEILDELGEPVPGFEEAESDEINGNHVRVKASWNGSQSLRSLAGRTIRLRFAMRDAKLYSFQFLP